MTTMPLLVRSICFAVTIILVLLTTRKFFERTTLSISIGNRTTKPHSIHGIFNATVDKNIVFPSLLLNASTTTRCDVIAHSRLYSIECNNTGKGKPRRLLVTATGRSGTSFLVEFLREHMALKVSHDNRIYSLDATDGAVSWLHAFNKDGCQNIFPDWGWRRRRRMATTATPLLGHDERYFHHVVHLVRDPLLSIRSRWNKGDIRSITSIGRCQTAQGEFEPSANVTFDTLRETLRHWVLWNSYIEAFAEWRIRTESWDGAAVQKLYEIANNTAAEPPLPPMPISVGEIDTLLASTAHNTNSNHTSKTSFLFTWDMLTELDADYTLMAQLMAQRYGYHVPESPAYNKKLAGHQQSCGFLPDGRWDCSLVPI